MEDDGAAAESVPAAEVVPAHVAQEANRRWWEAAVPVHLASDFYDVDGWLADGRGPRPREVEVLGDVAGLDLVHLQCHFGKDTLAWARAGATVTGLDFSEVAIAAARGLAERAGRADRADFVCAPVAEGPPHSVDGVSTWSTSAWVPCAGCRASTSGRSRRPGSSDRAAGCSSTRPTRSAWRWPTTT